MCHMVKVIPAQSGFGGIMLPTSCDGEDPTALANGVLCVCRWVDDCAVGRASSRPTYIQSLTPNAHAATATGNLDQDALRCKSKNYVILADESVYIDQQPLKLQESPEVMEDND